MRKIESYKLDRSRGDFIRVQERGLETGTVDTVFGTVGVDQYTGDDGEAYVYLSMAHRSRRYFQHLDRKKPATRRGLAIIAGRFAAEVAA